MDVYLQTLATGLLFGGLLALLSTGLALIFGVMRVVNFAQGDFVMLGMYFAVFAYAFVPLDPVVLALLAFVVLAALGYLLHWGVVSRVTGTGSGAFAGHDAQLILTLGVSLILQNGALMVLGPNPRRLQTPRLAASWDLAGVLLNQARTVAFLVAVVLVAALFWFLRRTTQGRSLRAAADDPDAATYVGIDVARAHRLAFSLGVGLAAAGGGLLATFYVVQPYVAWDFIVLMFVAVVLGGMGSVLGAGLGGLTIGVVWSVSLLFMPLQLQYVGVFTVFLAVLYLRPQGLLGQRARA